jgi:hypothetical protein
MGKPIIDGKERDWQRGDVVQITNEDHAWFPALIVVSDPKSFGVQGYLTVVTSEGTNPAYIRLRHDEIEYIGAAAILTNLE